MAAEAAISSAVELLGDLLIQKVKSVRGVERKVQSLKEELKRMQSFLKDANRKQFEDERVRNWISEIREVAQDAQDTIEIFLLNVDNANSMGLFNKCTNFVRRMRHLDTIGDEIESIRGRLDAVDKSRERYGIKDLGVVAESAWRSQVESLRRLCPWQKDEQLVGVEDDVQNLLRESILDEEKKGLSIAVLEGMGGIGKSALARKIYNHPDVAEERFDRRGWVVISSEFTPQETIKQLIFQLQRSEDEKQKLLDEIKRLEELTTDKDYIQDELKQMLHNQLEGKSYFIVLDDAWEKEHLESLITAFPNQQDKRSRLLVTTRNKITTNYDQYVHKMKLLDPEKSWELLLKKAFIGSRNNKHTEEELESIGRQILEKCHGLPLAISVAGGLLVGTQTQSRWKEILNQMNSYLGRAGNSVSSILELSYQNLSPQLKSCFLCLAFFKEDSTICAKRLVNIWVEQGLIQEVGSRKMNEVAKGYLNDLINRSMVQIDDSIYDDRVKKCRIHDLVREVCLRKAKEEIGLHIVKQGEEGIIPSDSSHKPRHCVVYGKNLETSSSNQNKHIRSLFLLNVQGGGNVYMTTHYWKSFQLLQTLDLDGFAFRTFPGTFRLLLGLKCLRIHKSHVNFGDVLELPSWLDRLKKLEVLDMGWGGVQFPRLVSLKMESLRYFRACNVHGPVKIEKWRKIECLKDISHRDWMRCRSKPTNCRELGISFDGWMEPQEMSMVRASLQNVENLATLHLIWGMNPIDITLTIPNLHTNITKLKLIGLMLKCPAATVFPPNLSHLTLEVSYLEEDPMAELGKLPKLLYLKLHKRPYSGETMHVLHDGFPCLKTLSILGMRLLRAINIEEGGMPQLKHLRFRYCPNLNTRNLSEHINISTV